MQFMNVYGKDRPSTRHEGPESQQEYSFTFSLTSVLGGGWGSVINVTTRPFYPWKLGPVLIVQKAGWATASVWVRVKNFATTGI